MSYHHNQSENRQQRHQYTQSHQNDNQYRTNSQNNNFNTTGQYGIQQNSRQQQSMNQGMQQQNMIKNPQSNVVGNVKTPAMNDRDYLNDILATEKYLVDNHLMFSREASHTDLFNDAKQILNETLDCQRDIFNTMFKNGFYGFQAAQGSDIQKSQQQFSNYLGAQDPYSR